MCQTRTDELLVVVDIRPADPYDAYRYDALEPDLSWRCTEPGCLFELEEGVDGDDSARYRVEEHARNTGHRLGLYLDRWADYPYDPIETVGTGLTGDQR